MPVHEALLAEIYQVQSAIGQMTGKPEIEVQPSLTASMGSYSSLWSATLRDQTLCALRKCKSPFSRATRHSRPQNDPGHKTRIMCPGT